jgi:hypothetical protein
VQVGKSEAVELTGDEGYDAADDAKPMATADMLRQDDKNGSNFDLGLRIYFKSPSPRVGLPGASQIAQPLLLETG